MNEQIVANEKFTEPLFHFLVLQHNVPRVTSAALMHRHLPAQVTFRNDLQNNSQMNIA